MDSSASIRLSGFKLWAMRGLWALLAALATAAFIVSTHSRSVGLLTLSWLHKADLARLGLHYTFLARYLATWDNIVFGLFVTLALLIIFSKSDHPVSIFASAMVFFSGTALTRPADSLVIVPLAWRPWILLSVGLGFAMVSTFCYISPDGKLPRRWMASLALPTAALPLAWFLVPWFADPLYHAWPPKFLPGPLALPWVISALWAQIYRYRRHSTPDQRRKTRWIVTGGILAGGGYIAFGYLLPLLAPAVTEVGTARLWYIMAGVPFLYLVVAALPVTIAISILRHRLWDVDLILNRTVVGVAMTGILAGVYTAAIRVFQLLFVAMTGTESEAAIILTTLVLAAVFTPIKDWVQGVADRRLKDPDDPAAALKDLDRQVQSVLQVMDPLQLTSLLLDKAVLSVSASSGAMYLLQSEEMRLVHEYGDWDGEAVISVPIHWNGTSMGRLALGPSVNGRPYGDPERELLEGCAARVAQAMALSSALGGIGPIPRPAPLTPASLLPTPSTH